MDGYHHYSGGDYNDAIYIGCSETECGRFAPQTRPISFAICNTNPEDEKNMFATLQFTVNETLRTILLTKENNLTVVHPIAVYYGD